MKKYDAVIIGAGPAGLMAARELANKNINFLVIDSKKEIGLPLKCGEGIRRNGFLELFGQDDYDFIKNKTSKMLVYAGETKKILHIDYLMLDRPKFEKWLALPIKNKIRLNTKCEDITKKEDCLEIITDKGKINADLVILAYGCDYRIQEKFGLIKEKPVLVPCYGGIFDNHKLAVDTIHFFIDADNSAVLWIFPKNKDEANAGIEIFSGSKQNIKLLFSRLLKKYNLKLKCKKNFSGIFPNNSPIKKTYSDNLLVCGDAAGQVYAGSGEGIYFALKSGELAGKAAAEAISKRNYSGSFLKKYETNWKKSFGKQMKCGLLFSDLLLFGFKHKKLLKYLIKIPTENDLINLFMKGGIPIKARIIKILSKLYCIKTTL